MMQKVNFVISSAEKYDAAEISEIEKSNFSTPWTEKQILEEIEKENSIFLIAKNNEKVIGYISGQLILDEFYISNIAVKSEFRKNGIAYSLIKRLIAELFNLPCIFATLEVRDSNTPARNLYEKCGFKYQGNRKGFYSKPFEDACIYTYYFNENGVNIN